MADGPLEERAERAAAGDSAALSWLVDEVQHPVYRLALRFLGHPEDAKDATQEILVRVITHLGQFEGRSQFMTWAYTIAMRQLMRTRKRELESAVKGAEAFAAALDQGLADRDFTAQEAEYRLLSAEVRISCTYAMLLRLSRPLRASYILGDAMGMPDTLGPELRRTAGRMGARPGRLPRPACVTWPPRWHPRTCSASTLRSIQH
jgi:RNA polymerase sigma factor (sigma-70 family)